MRYIDLRSDTVTIPTDKMRTAMARAVVGDDVYEDDPTVKELEKMSADILGKEAALFVPSGTFGNQLSLLTHTKPGDEVILEGTSHIIMHEVGAAALISNVQLRTIPGKDGQMNPIDVEKSIRPEDIHFPETGLICMENAHSVGTVLPIENMTEIKAISDKYSIPVHLDGARIFNAANSLDVEPKEIAKYADSVMFCLSKGLCAPVGSMLVGSVDFINKARKNRKLMGGGLRQVGILAAAGIVALEEMVSEIDKDHENARYLADKLNEFKDINVIMDRRDINMVFFRLEDNVIDEGVFIEKLLSQGIKINGKEDGEYRFVTNYWVSKEDIDKVINAIKNILN
ncbi:low-specificity L-threonine aldolase [Clostridiisalibacter paucivorans]|uniref:low-specificity L-threonine aldolase n=1 Tax=Clostridiisalibacter paucivorans TaxID=408753 RepID=UPI00047880D6|nr:low-specificity L-threonine aldolase [Clostridiisalibacter paucivorans]